MIRINNKIFIVAAIIIGMVGIATADQINIYDVGTSHSVASLVLVPGGAAVTKDLVVSGENNPLGTMHTTTGIVVVLAPGIGTPADILVTYSQPPNPFGAGPFFWPQLAGVGGSDVNKIKFAASPSAPLGAKYQIGILDTQGTPIPIIVTIEAKTKPVPELPTGILSTAGIIGLLGLVRYRKKNN